MGCRGLYEVVGKSRFMVCTGTWTYSISQGKLAPGKTGERPRSRGQNKSKGISPPPSASEPVRRPRRNSLPSSIDTRDESDQRKSKEKSDGARTGSKSEGVTSRPSSRLKKRRASEPPQTPQGGSGSLSDLLAAWTHDAATNASRVKNKVDPPVDVEELWQIISIPPVSVSGLWETHETTRLEVQEFVDVFSQAKQTGLNSTLARKVYHHFDEFIESEDLSPAEVAHLCSLLIENGVLLSVRQAREQLAVVKEACRGAGESDTVYADGWLTLGHFKALISLLSKLMRIDEAYILSHLAWVKTGHFDMTETLAAQITVQCAHKFTSKHGNKAEAVVGMGSSHYGVTVPNLKVLSLPFDLNDFVKLVQACGIDDTC